MWYFSFYLLFDEMRRDIKLRNYNEVFSLIEAVMCSVFDQTIMLNLWHIKRKWCNKF